MDIATLRKQIGELGLSAFDEVVGLGGKEYRSATEAAFQGVAPTLRFPFAGLSFFEMTQATKQAVDDPKSDRDG